MGVGKNTKSAEAGGGADGKYDDESKQSESFYPTHSPGLSPSLTHQHLLSVWKTSVSRQPPYWKMER